MILYLVRHGKAEVGDVDAQRELTGGGRKAVGRVARALARGDVRASSIEHSGLVRARQTAEILAQELGVAIARTSGLRPEDSVEDMAQVLRQRRDNAPMLVGHLPFMERLASLLLVGNPDAGIIHFRTAAAACLSNDSGTWQLEWHLVPDLAQ